MLQWMLHSLSPFHSFHPLQGENVSEERPLCPSCLPTFLPLPTLVYPFIFDTPSSNGKNLKVYSRRRKDVATIPPLIASSKLGNVPPKVQNLVITALRDGDVSCLAAYCRETASEIER